MFEVCRDAVVERGGGRNTLLAAGDAHFQLDLVACDNAWLDAKEIGPFSGKRGHVPPGFPGAILIW